MDLVKWQHLQSSWQNKDKSHNINRESLTFTKLNFIGAVVYTAALQKEGTLYMCGQSTNMHVRWIRNWLYLVVSGALSLWPYGEAATWPGCHPAFVLWQQQKSRYWKRTDEWLDGVVLMKRHCSGGPCDWDALHCQRCLQGASAVTFPFKSGRTRAQWARCSRAPLLRALLLCTAGSPHFSPAAPRRPVIFSNMQHSPRGLLRKRFQDTKREEKYI